MHGLQKNLAAGAGLQGVKVDCPAGLPAQREGLPVVLVPGGHAVIDDNVRPEAVHVHRLRHSAVQVPQRRLHHRSTLVYSMFRHTKIPTNPFLYIVIRCM